MEHSLSQWITYLYLVVLVWFRYRNVWRGKTPEWALQLTHRRHSYAHTLGHVRPQRVVRRALKRHVAQPGRPSFFAVSHA